MRTILSCGLLLNLVSHAFGAVGGTTAPSITVKVHYANAGQNLFSVKSMTPAGYTIFVGPGVYNVGATNLAKEGVNWYFMPGSIVSNSSSVARIYDNSGAGEPTALNWEVLGYGTFIDTGGFGPNGSGSFLISNTASRVRLQGKRSIADNANTGFASLSVLSAASVDIDFDSLQAANAACGFWWDNGEVRGRVGLITSDNGGPAIYCTGTGRADCYLNVGLIYSTNDTAIVFHPTSSGNKLWLTVGEILGSPTGWASVIDVTGGKLYLDFQKLSILNGATTSADAGLSLIGQSGGELWVKGRKWTATNGIAFIEQSAGWSIYEIPHWEDAGSGQNTRPYNVHCTGGTNILNGGRALTKWGPFYKLEGGQAHLEKMTVDTLTTIAPTNSCLWIVGAGPVPVVKDCVFIPGGHFSVTNATAADLRIFGYLHTRSNHTVTLTARGGAATVSQYFDR
jgi:hypothetical protein